MNPNPLPIVILITNNNIARVVKKIFLLTLLLLIMENLIALAMLIAFKIRQSIHFWWVELDKSRYKRDESPFLSAIKWLEEKSYQIIFQKETTKAFGFLTGLWDMLKNIQFKIHEIGVDATCKYTVIIKLSVK